MLLLALVMGHLMATRTNFTFNDQLAVLYQDAVDNIRFLKQQQWSVTNYAALIYAATLYLYSQGWLGRPDMRINLVSFPLVACVANIVVLWMLQKSMSKFRDRVQWMYKNQFTDTQRAELKLLPRDLAEDRSIAILLTLFTLLGALVTAYVLLVGDRQRPSFLTRRNSNFPREESFQGRWRVPLARPAIALCLRQPFAIPPRRRRQSVNSRMGPEFAESFVPGALISASGLSERVISASGLSERRDFPSK